MSETLQWIAIIIIISAVAWLNFFRRGNNSHRGGCHNCDNSQCCFKDKARQKKSRKTCTRKK